MGGGLHARGKLAGNFAGQRFVSIFDDRHRQVQTTSIYPVVVFLCFQIYPIHIGNLINEACVWASSILGFVIFTP